MAKECKDVTIGGVTYVPKESVEKLPYVIVRTARAGVFAGYLVKKDGQETTLESSRRLWYWDGAASLSQLSQDGVQKPSTCKFPCEVLTHILYETIEILQTTTKAKDSIANVPVWKV